MLDKNIIVNSPTLKDDLDFIVADSKTQKGEEVSNDDQHKLFQQTPLRINCNTPKKAVLSDLSDNIQEGVSENITDLKAEFLALKSFVMDELYSINVNLDHSQTEQFDHAKHLEEYNENM